MEFMKNIQLGDTLWSMVHGEGKLIGYSGEMSEDIYLNIHFRDFGERKYTLDGKLGKRHAARILFKERPILIDPTENVVVIPEFENDTLIEVRDKKGPTNPDPCWCKRYFREWSVDYRPICWNNGCTSKTGTQYKEWYEWRQVE
jgi:hypothetical protein